MSDEFEEVEAPVPDPEPAPVEDLPDTGSPVGDPDPKNNPGPPRPEDEPTEE